MNVNHDENVNTPEYFITSFSELITWMNNTQYKYTLHSLKKIQAVPAAEMLLKS